MTDDLDLVRRLEAWAALVAENATTSVFVSDEFRAEHREKSALLSEAADRITALLDENAALKREVEEAKLAASAHAHAQELAAKAVAGVIADKVNRALSAEASRDALAGKLDIIHTAAILYIGGEADVSHDAATKLIDRIATIARSAKE